MKQHIHQRKKLFGLMTAIIATIVITIYSCKKEGITQPESGNEFNVSVVDTKGLISSRSTTATSTGNPLLKFATIADYENMVNNPNEQVHQNFEKTVLSLKNFKSYSQVYPNDTSFRDQELTNMLNPDEIIQIGNYYIKVVPWMETVFVLPITDSAYYYDLLTDYPQTGLVTMFSTSDDVLELIKAGMIEDTTSTVLVELEVQEPSNPALRGFSFKHFFARVAKDVAIVGHAIGHATVVTIHALGIAAKVTGHALVNAFHATVNFLGLCGAPRAPAGQTITDTIYGYTPSAPGTNFTVNLSFSRSGIHYNLVAVMNDVPNIANATFSFYFEKSIDNIDHQQNGYIYYEPRCQSATSNPSIQAGNFSVDANGGSTQTYTAYRGTRNLAKYYFFCNVVINYKASGNVNTPVMPEDIGIRYNM